MPEKAGTARWRKERRKEYLEQKECRYYIMWHGVMNVLSFDELVEKLEKYLSEDGGGNASA